MSHPNNQLSHSSTYPVHPQPSSSHHHPSQPSHLYSNLHPNDSQSQPFPYPDPSPLSHAHTPTPTYSQSQSQSPPSPPRYSHFPNLTHIKRRRKTSPQELAILEGAFEENALPSSGERGELARRTGMSGRAVQIWFQNKRQTEKRKIQTISLQSTNPQPHPLTSSTLNRPPNSSIPSPSSSSSPLTGGGGASWSLDSRGMNGWESIGRGDGLGMSTGMNTTTSMVSKGAERNFEGLMMSSPTPTPTPTRGMIENNTTERSGYPFTRQDPNQPSRQQQQQQQQSLQLRSTRYPSIPPAPIPIIHRRPSQTRSQSHSQSHSQSRIQQSYSQIPAVLLPPPSSILPMGMGKIPGGGNGSGVIGQSRLGRPPAGRVSGFVNGIVGNGVGLPNENKARSGQGNNSVLDLQAAASPPPTIPTPKAMVMATPFLPSISNRLEGESPTPLIHPRPISSTTSTLTIPHFDHMDGSTSSSSSMFSHLNSDNNELNRPQQQRQQQQPPSAGKPQFSPYPAPLPRPISRSGSRNSNGFNSNGVASRPVSRASSGLMDLMIEGGGGGVEGSMTTTAAAVLDGVTAEKRSSKIGGWEPMGLMMPRRSSIQLQLEGKENQQRERERERERERISRPSLGGRANSAMGIVTLTSMKRDLSVSVSVAPPPDRPRSSLGFSYSLPPPRRLAGKISHMGEDAIMDESQEKLQLAPMLSGSSHKLSRGILDEMCERRELPWIKKDKEEDDQSGLEAASRKMKSMLDAMKSSPAGMSHKDVSSSPSPSTDEESDHHAWTTAGSKRKRMEKDESALESDEERYEGENVTPMLLPRSKSALANVRSSAETRPMLRRLASLDYYAGTPPRRSSSFLGSQVRRLEAVAAAENHCHNDNDSDSDHPPQQKRPRWSASDERQTERSRSDLSQYTTTSSSSYHRSSFARASSDDSFATGASHGGMQIVTPVLSREIPSLLPVMRKATVNPASSPTGRGRLDDNDQECAFLLLGLGGGSNAV